MNWIREPLSDICDTTSGGTPSRKVQEYYQNGTIPWVKSGELENNIILDTEEYITEEALANSSANTNLNLKQRYYPISSSNALNILIRQGTNGITKAMNYILEGVKYFVSKAACA